MTYERETRLAYNPLKASRYKKQQTEGLSWARFTTWREKLCVGLALTECNLSDKNKILDIPCGTGVLSQLLGRFSSSIISSDISIYMMKFARENINNENNNYILADITGTPFKKMIFDCVITIGLMHRLPKKIRLQTLCEIVSVSKKFIILSYSISSPFQIVKHSLLKLIWPDHSSSPFPMKYSDVINDFTSCNLRVRKVYKIAALFSSERIFLLEKVENKKSYSF